MLGTLLFALSQIATVMCATHKNVSEEVVYRPATHFTPPKNFMNDPNGLLYDREAGVYHLYYQYNPNDTIAGNQHWGHATSPDLFHWTDKPIALTPQKDGNGSFIFSGSMVNDENNTSGFFPGKGKQNFVAFYTLALSSVQTQALAYSLDGGLSFIPYKHNPIINLNLSEFRDPQVQWYDPGKKWVMTIALSRDHIIRFYESKDLIHWRASGDFRAGVIGVDYECPNLVPMKDEKNHTKWVLFVSINPGMPLGGSGTQYFIGNFNGTTFVPDNHDVNFVDFAKDNYALQYINPGQTLTSEDIADATYIGWFGNWQYCQETPTGNWRSAMTYARKLSLKRDWLGDLRLVQEPANLESLRATNATNVTTPVHLNHSKSIGESIPLPSNSTAVEVLLNSTIANLSISAPPGSSRLVLEFYNDNHESINIGIDPGSGQLWLDRSNTTGFDNPFFTGQFSVPIKQPVHDVKLRVILDASLLELYADDGFAVASAVYYSEEPLTHVRVKMVNGGSSSSKLSVYPLKKTMDRKTLAN